ncbi:Nuclear pore complex protein Nup93 [Lamellibrachia satsuma]|nr:Nuclear pore complex protein Nup93 [Lamellibrachia satsuma]
MPLSFMFIHLDEEVSMMDVDGGFGDLLQQAQQLTADMDTGMELPRVERNLQQLKEAAQRMASRVPLVAQETTDVKASLLLGSRGYDIQRVAHKLEGLSTAKTFEPLEPIRDTDIQGFLKNERENALLAAIEQTRKNTFEETERRHWANMENEWEQEKQKILTALVGTGQDMLDFPQESQNLLSDTMNLQGRSAMDSVEMAYSRQVYIYNDKVVQGGNKPSLVNMFISVASSMEDKKVAELWNMVHHMTDVQTSIVGSPVKARTSTKMLKAYTRQAQRYLEQSYLKYVTLMVYSNLQQAQLGGVPGTYNLVRSFLNIRLPVMMPQLEDGEVEGLPIWALIYYCMRCGDLTAAWDIICSVDQNLGDFGRFFKEYMESDDRRLGANSEREIRLQYRRSVRNSTDPYKRAVYCLTGKCDPRDNHSEVADKTEDYLWLKLCQLSHGSEEDSMSQERLTLPQFQVMLLEEHGESHFNAYQQPFLYFEVLLLTAQFEAAIEFMSRIESMRCHAVHVALAFYELHYLLLPSSSHSKLLSREGSDPEPLRRLNFARLIMMYTRKFEVTDPREALQYFYFLRDLTTAQGDNLFMSCVSELVLETREFDMLLGQLGKDGSRKSGAIDKFNGDTQKIIELVAQDTEGKGLLEDAITLYDLAKNYDKVLELLNKLLSQVVSQPSTPQSTRDRLKQLALAIAERYRQLAARGSQHNTETFHLLLDLMAFFDHYHMGKTEEAHRVIHELKLLPFAVKNVEQKVKTFRFYSDEVRRSLPDILLATMSILHTQYKRVRGSGSQSPQPPCSLSASSFRDDGGKQLFIDDLRSQARALITFAGMIPYRMPSDTNARLVQMEVLMN